MSDPDQVASRATRVVLFEDRAEVTRVAELPLSPGSRWVALAGVSTFVDERSVQARVSPKPNGEVKAQARVLGARVRWRAHAEKELGREAIEALEAEARAARAREREAEEAEERARSEEARAKALRAKWIETVSAVPRGVRAEEAVASWRASIAEIERAVAGALAAQAEAREAQQQAREALVHVEQRLARGALEKHRHEALIEVEIDASEAHDAVVEVTYRVPCALWRPEHVIRLAGPVPAQGASAKLEIITLAAAWQRTGEAWEDVEVRFSTARPARAASAPLLSDDVLASRRKTEQELRRVEVSAREQQVMTAGAAGARAVDEMPGVDDGGEPLTYAPKGKVTIASDGLPFRVEVARAAVDAKIERVIVPEIAPVAHLRASATLEKCGPLLAGPVRVARGKSLVGRAKIDFVGKGEPFEIGLGTDDGVRVRRRQSEERDTVAVIGTQKVKRKVEVFLSNLSNEARRVLVTERIPVSEIDDVEISLTESGGLELDVKDGFLKREVELSPHATREITIGYEIKASAKVILPV